MPQRTPASEKEGAPASHEQLIQTPRELAKLAESLAGQSVIAFDTEFLRERTFFPQLGLLQVADRQQSWLVDPLALPKDDLQPLLDIFTEPKILKVAHAVEQDQECLYHGYGIVATPVLDTAVAAALTGYGDQVGLSTLLRRLLNIRLAKGHTRTDWLKRPLPASMAAYALADVAHLVEAAEALLADLDSRGRREWAMKLSEELGSPARYSPDPDEIARQLALSRRLDAQEYTVLREVVRWREERVRKADVPRRWLAEDQLLVKLASARPTTPDELSNFRGLGSRMRDFGADGLLKAIRRGMAVAPEKRVHPPRRTEPDSEESPALAVLKCFVGLLAGEQQVPVRYLIDSDAYVRLLRGRFRSVSELRKSGLLSPHAVDLLGDEIIAFLEGKRGLKLTGGKAVRYQLDEE
jgi:ribonuclease D